MSNLPESHPEPLPELRAYPVGDAVSAGTMEYLTRPIDAADRRMLRELSMLYLNKSSKNERDQPNAEDRHGNKLWIAQRRVANVLWRLASGAAPDMGEFENLMTDLERAAERGATACESGHGTMAAEQDVKDARAALCAFVSRSSQEKPSDA